MLSHCLSKNCKITSYNEILILHYKKVNKTVNEVLNKKIKKS